MKTIYLLIFVLLTNFTVLAQNQSIIPKPVSLEMRNGNFEINSNTAIHIQNKELVGVSNYLKNSIQSISGIQLSNNKHLQQKINLILESNQKLGAEGYTLDIENQNITIKANSKNGIFYGIQSLLQLLPSIRTNAKLLVPQMKIVDYPRFSWRGMHLDVSRHFFGPEVIKNYINLLATYKMNTFHWHLVDDQGWRIEIKKYPKLTDIGGWRVDKTSINWRERPQATVNESPTYGGFYTQEQLKEIVQYAAERNITIVPEIEMPGHAAAAIAAYPELSCNHQFQLPLTGGNYTNISSNFCAGNDSNYTFIKNVLTEVLDIFPSKYIHIGGDEVDKGSWKNCPKCQAKIKTEHLKNEEALQSYFVQSIEKFLISKNRKLIGWDEILEGGLAPEATVMSWRGESGGIAAAKMKHQVVMTPGSPCYFDHYQAGPEGEPFAIGGFNSLKKVYDYEPIPSELSEEESKYVLGSQGNVWTEFITTAEHLEYMILPRLLALSEVTWSPKGSKDWDDFNSRLQSHFKIFCQKGWRYCPGNFTVAIQPVFNNGKLLVNLLSEAKNSEIYYTLDGSEPNLQSNKYLQPIEINQTSTLKAITAVNNNIMSLQAAKQQFSKHKAFGATVTYSTPVSKYYQAEGAFTLTNGVRGTKTHGRNWHGFSSENMIATFQLANADTLHTLNLSCLQSYRDWIFCPASVKFEVSSDGVNYKELRTMKNPIDIQSKAKEAVEYKLEFKPEWVKNIRITAQNNLCPKGHSGEGNMGWIFIDELIAE